MPTARALGAIDLDLKEAPVSGARPAATTAASLFAQPLAPMLTVLAVALLVILAITTARTAGMVAMVWAANGLAVGVWLRSGRGVSFDLSFGGLIALGIVAGQFLAGNPPTLALGFSLANMIEIVTAVALARRFAPTLNLATVSGAWRFLFFVAVLAPIVASLMVATMLLGVTGESFLVSFRTWWLGHTLGLAVVAPFVLAFERRQIAALLNPLRAAETVGLFALLILLCLAVFFSRTLPLIFALVPVLIVIAARLRVIGVTAALIVVSVAAVAALALGVGPSQLVSADNAERTLVVQVAILFGFLPIVLIASLLEERDRLSARARAGQARAERASAAKSRLLANVAHEIKSPIGGVIGIGELWASGKLGPVTETQIEMAQMLVKTARQVEALAHDLLDVARAESGAVKVELRPTDVRGILEDVRNATLLRPEAQSLIISVVCEGDGLVAIADSQRLAQVVDNLATNAVKYAGGGGTVVLRARRVYDGVRIEVVDRGPGLSADKQAQLFEPFNRLGLERSAVEGHGIGLALAKGLIELQGGSIGVESELGHGATFWVELPAA
ncbi:histidine kinase [Brevundimonas sp. LM2]|uniref:sensor histidine kinase n=1 Tax=Brevundimonas sp. LM2 TaxID=1938605 RepID=UPI000983DF7F|nr:ATP-binding protein [Brevundimonas sp. LM2]AQR62457.1 histidine kinase [Brevundimonas sp. LM2]